MSNIDLDIKNYTQKDIEKFFKLKGNYTLNDVEYKSYEIRETLLQSDLVDKDLKRDVIIFCTAAKQWLLYSKFGEQAIEAISINENRNNINKDRFNLPPTSIPKRGELNKLELPLSNTNIIDRESNEIIYQQGKPYKYTNPSEFFKGDLNPLNTRIINKCLNIDTKFRNNYENTKSSDFMVQLSTKINKVVSLQLTNIEIPLAFYNISEANGNNFFYLKINENSFGNIISKSTIIILPDGVYTASLLIDKLNCLISPKNEDGSIKNSESIFSYIEFVLDLDCQGNGKGNAVLRTFGEKKDSIDSIELDFTKNKTGQNDQIDIKKKLGWTLGYQKSKYIGSKYYRSETVVDVKTNKYIYLAIDDYQKSVNNLFLEGINNNSINENILARISLNSDDFTILMDNSIKLITEPRIYFGPVDLQKLRVRIFDDHGRILDMNNTNYSFVLTLKILYDI